jgi:hypothetical protein
LTLAGLACLAALGVYGALRRTPAYYAAALVRDQASAARSSDEFLQSAAGVASDSRKAGAWEAVFTVDQINGWLAVDVPRNFPDLLPAEFAAPRVFVHPGDLTIACRYHSGSIDTVLSIACDVYLQEPNVLAIRVKAVRAGLLPLPLGNVLDAITHAARGLELPLQWRRVGGDPVALVSVIPPHARAKARFELEHVELGEGEIAVIGHTGAGGPLAMATRDKAASQTPPADGDDRRRSESPAAPDAGPPATAPSATAPDSAQSGPLDAAQSTGPSTQPAAASRDSVNDTLQR